MGVWLLVTLHSRALLQRTHTREAFIEDGTMHADAVADMHCRICLEDDAFDCMLRPCLCAGSHRLVHRDCLDRWRCQGSNTTAYSKCGTCLKEYQLSDIPMASLYD